MLYTTDRKRALADKGNRAAAMDVLMRDRHIGARTQTEDQLEEWIDDLILEWVEEFSHDLERGLLGAAS